jgi:hypothetical protein
MKKIRLDELSGELADLIRSEMAARQLDGEILLSELSRSSQNMIKRETARKEKKKDKPKKPMKPKKNTEKKSEEVTDDARKEVYRQLGLRYSEENKWVLEHENGEITEITESLRDVILEACKRKHQLWGNSPVRGVPRLASF